MKYREKTINTLDNVKNQIDSLILNIENGKMSVENVISVLKRTSDTLEQITNLVTLERNDFTN